VIWLRRLWRSIFGLRPDPRTIVPADPRHAATLRRADRLIADYRRGDRIIVGRR
jgi:hypothetical protein